ncbi:MAG: hypothetical protein AAB681_02625 [Patescibacteria group bacterium]
MKLYDVIRKEQPKQEEPQDVSIHSFVPTEPQSKRNNRRRFIFFGLLIFSLTTIYIAGIYLVRAKIIITERHIPFTVEGMLLELPHETNIDSKRLSFQTMTVTSEINREIFGSELTQVTGKAKGSVVFLNEYTKSSIALKNGTRLVGQNGKTYTTAQSVVIPGYTTDAKKKKVAGASPSVAIVAMEAGPTYNSKGLSLTISGYSGAKKTGVYARSVGEFTGGETGMRHTVSDAERPALLESLKTQLSERLRRETRAQVPSGFITYPDLQFISIDTDSLALVGEGVKFSAKIKGNMLTYLIPQELFEVAIAKEVLSDQSYTNVAIPNILALSVIPMSAIPTSSQTPPSTISLKISGQGTIITKAQSEKIIQALLGGGRDKFDSVISSFPEIEFARFRLTPFWAPFFPKQDRFFTVETQ